MDSPVFDSPLRKLRIALGYSLAQMSELMDMAVETYKKREEDVLLLRVYDCLALEQIGADPTCFLFPDRWPLTVESSEAIARAEVIRLQNIHDRSEGLFDGEVADV